LPVLAPAEDEDQLEVGIQPDGRIVVPTNQVLAPAGKQVTFPGRPVDLVLAEDGKTLVIKNQRDLIFLDVATGKIRQVLRSPVGFSAVGLLLLDGDVWASDVANDVRIARRQPAGQYRWIAGTPLLRPEIGGVAYPTGLCAAAPERLLVASNRGNTVRVCSSRTSSATRKRGRFPIWFTCISPATTRWARGRASRRRRRWWRTTTWRWGRSSRR
jgi:hypothetical protein